MTVFNALRNYLEPLLCLSAVVAAGISYSKYQHTKADLSLARDRFATAVRLNDSTEAELARVRLDKAAYAGLLAAEDSIHGKLIAAVRIKVPARDTFLVHDTLETTVTADSTRTATFHDSTFAGTIDGTVTAPPCCQPLAVAYRIHRPPFTPSVGFVQRDSRTVAVVVWQGERAEVDAPYSQIPAPPKRFVPYAEATLDPVGALTAAGGATFRLGGGISIVAHLDQRFELGQPMRLNFGIRKEW